MTIDEIIKGYGNPNDFEKIKIVANLVQNNILSSLRTKIEERKVNMNNNVTTDEGDELKESGKIYDIGFNAGLETALKIIDELGK